MVQEELKCLKGIRKITVLTAYDYQMTRIQDRGGIDIILVEDSFGMVVLVVNEILGMDEGYSPRHSKVYAGLNTLVSDVVQRYIEDVRAGKFPTKKQSFR